MLKRITTSIGTVVLAVLFIYGPCFAGSQQTSGLTTSPLYTNVRAYLNGVSSTGVQDGIWTDANFLVWTNDGMVDIVSRTQCLQSTENIDLAVETVEYSITSNYIKLMAVQFGSQSDSAVTQYEGLTKGNVWSVGNVEDVLEPVYWYEFSGKVGAYPTLESLSGATVSQHLKLYLATRPTAIADGGTVATPAVYDRALTLYIAAQAFLKDKQMTRYSSFMELYLAELDRYRQDFIEPAVKTDEVIKQ